MTDAPLDLDTVKAEFRKLGITITPLAGEYVVNFRDGTEATAIIAADLAEALEHGRQLAARVAKAPERATAAPGKQYRRPRRMTPKAMRRRMIRQHNRHLRARALRDKQDSDD